MNTRRKPKRVRYHVVPSRYGGWSVKRNGEQGMPIGMQSVQSKAQAVAWARRHAREEYASLRIHKRDGTIAEERTYPRSSDPRRTKG